MRVLVVEDEIKMASLIRRGLRSEGLAADVAIKGEDALWMAGSTGYDAIVLDVMLPGIDGFETCRRLREDGIWSPVIMLTARDSVEDRVAGLDGGADDYLPKPFSFAELLARLRALARRGPGPAPPRRGGAPAGARGGHAEARPGVAPRVPRRHRGEPVGQGVPAPGDVHAPPGRGTLALPAARARLGLRLREPLEHRRRLRPLPARQDRPAVRHHAARDRARRGLPPARLRPGASRGGNVLGLRAVRQATCAQLSDGSGG